MKVILNDHSSRSFCINAVDARVSILEPSGFLISINDVPDVLSSRIGIYADDTDIY